MSQQEVLHYFESYGAKIRRGELRLGRRHYALALAQSVRTAIHCGCGRFTAVELGVATGAGLRELCRIAEFFAKELGIEIGLFGFDRAMGLPEVSGYMDHPELWHTGAFKMPDPAELAAELPGFAKLVIGDISETIPEFEAELRTAPLGFAAFDVDLYSSTKHALRLLKFPPECYLPVVPSIFDNSEGALSNSEWCGEAAAVREFNEVNTLRKIDRKPVFEIEKFHACQIFDHPIRQGTVRSRFGLNLGKF